MALLAPVTTYFERIPKTFIDVYDASFQKWGRELQKVGKTVTFRFKKPLEPSPLSVDRRRIIGARLTMEFDRSVPGKLRAIVRPFDEAAEEAIRRHSAELEREMLH